MKVNNKISETAKMKLYQKILRESYGSLIKLSDYFLPHHKEDDKGNIIPPAEIHEEFSTKLIGTVGKQYRDKDDKKRTKNWYNLLAILPRGCAKSTYANVFFVIWLLLFSNKQYIVLIGATEKSIKVHFDTLKYEIENNTLLHEFGIKPLKGGQWNSTTIDIEAVNIKGFSYLTGKKEVRIENYSVSNFPRGLKKGHIRPQMFIIDDMEVKKSGNKPGVESKGYREEIRDCFDAKIVPSGFNDESCQIVMLGTIMNEAMLLYQLYDSALKGEASPHFETIKYSMVENYGLPNARSIWKEKMSVEDLEAKMKTAIKNGTQNVVYNEYLSTIIAPEDQIFHKKNFRYFNDYGGILEICDENGRKIDSFDIIKKKDTRIILTADIAFTTNERSDYTAIVVTAVDKEDNKYILDIKYDKWNLHEIVDIFKELVKTYNPVSIGVEEASGGKFLIELLEKELYYIKNFCGITGLKCGGVKKHDRIINKLQIPYKNGSIFHNADGAYVDDLEHQIISVTKDNIKSKNDDLVDAVSYVYDISDEGVIYASHTEESNQQSYNDFYVPSSYIIPI